MFNAFRSGDKAASSKRLSYVQVRHLLFVSLSCFIVLGSVSTWLIAQSSSSDDPAPIAFYPVSANGTNVLLDSTTNHFNGYIPTNISVAYGPGPATNTEAIYISAGMAATVPQTNSFSESAFTFATWYRGSTNSQTVSSIASGSDVETNKWSLYSDANGVPHLAVSAPSGEAQVLSASSTNGLDVNDGYWHFLTGVVQTNSVELYVDNTESQTNVDWAGKQSSSMQVGSTNTTYSPFTVSDAQLFDTALTSTQVANVQNSIQPSAGSLNPATSSSKSSSATAEASPEVGGGIHPDTGGSNLFTIYGGNEQIVPVSTFATNSLQVLLTNSSGTAISGASIKFAIASGSDGGVATTNGGTTASSQTVTTNSSGIATIYYKSSTDLLKNNLITSTDTADSLTVTFTERCGTQSGLVSWFSADQAAGSGVALPSNGAVIGTWVDLALGNSVTTGSNQPTFVTSDTNGNNAEPAVHFSGNQYLYNSVNLNLNKDITIISVASCSNLNAQQYSIDLGQANATGQTRGIGYNGGLQAFTTWGHDASGAAPPFTNPFTEDFCTLDSTLTIPTFYRNGVNSTPNPAPTISGVGPLTSGITVGALAQGAGGLGWNGDISELLVYDHLLTSAEEAAVGQYIGDKYKIYNPYATWCKDTTKYTTAEIAEIAKNQWNQAQANAYLTLQSNTSGVITTGLISWFHADSLTGANGSSVTAWTDSALGNNVSAGSTSPTLITSDINSQNAVRFNGQAWMYSPENVGAGTMAGMTVVTVGRSNSPNAQGYSFWLGSGATFGFRPSGESRAIGYTNYDEWADFDGYYNGAEEVTGAPSTGNWTQEQWSLAPSGSNTTTIGNVSPSVTFLQQGTTKTQVTVNNLLELTSGITIGGRNNGIVDPQGGQVGYNGDIAEVLVYDHPLSSAEQQTLGKYLGDKYGVYDPNATWYNASQYTNILAKIKQDQLTEAQANAYLALQSNTSGVVTTGLISWFHADSLTGANGSSVTAWTDSALGNNVSAGSTSPTLITSDVNSQNAVRFNGQAWMYSPQNIGAGTMAGMTVVTVGRSNNPNAQGYSFWLGSGATFGYRPSGESRAIGYTNYNEWADFDGYYNGAEEVTGAPSTGNWTQEQWSLAPSGSNTTTIGNVSPSVTFLQQGTTKTQVTVNNLSELTSGITIGGRNNGIVDPQGGQVGYNGDIAEVLVYDHPLSATEQDALGKYLGDKYGVYDPNATWYNASQYTNVLAKIKQDQLTEAQANAYLTLQSNTSGVVTTGLISWFHADSLTGANGSSVTAWTDSALGNNVSAGSTSPTLITSDVNSQNAVRFNGQAWMYSPQNIGAGTMAGMTVVTVGRSNNPNAQGYSFWLGSGATFGFRPSGESRAIGYTNYDEWADFDGYYNGAEEVTGAPSTGNWTQEQWSLAPSGSNTTTIGNVSPSVTFLQGGTHKTQITVNNLLELTCGITIGGRNNGIVDPQGGQVGYNGDIAEVLVYDHPLSSTEQQTLGKYLGGKYGVYDPNAAWINGQGYTSSEIQHIAQNEWTLAQANAYKTLQSNTSGVLTTGLISWFKADSTVTTNGTAVTSWTDSAQSNVLQSASNNSTFPTYVPKESTGQPGVRFSGTTWLNSVTSDVAGVSADMTFVTVVSSSDPNATQFSVGLGQPTSNKMFRALGYDNSVQYFTTWNDDVFSLAVPSADSFNIEAASINPGLSAVTFYRNGSATGPVNLPYTALATTTGMTVGGQVPNTNLWQGDISEVLVYDHQLSPTDMATVTSYLSKKYAIMSFSQPSGTSSSSPLSVTINNVPTGASVYYTTNGTAPAPSTTAAAWTNALPNPASPNTKLYTAAQALNITGSCPIQAAAFISYTDENGKTDYQQVGATITAQYYVADTNNIGVTNAWQTTYSLSLTAATVNNLSSGGSGLTYLQDYLLGYKPTVYSTNGDGLSDLQNYQLGYSATQTNISGDGQSNAYDLANGIDPFLPYVAPTPPTPQSGYTLTVTITLPTGQ